jgi:hypothetical protein
LHQRGYVEGYALQTILPSATRISVRTLLRQWVFWAPRDARFPRLAHGLLILRWWEAAAVMHGARAALRDGHSSR